MTLDTFGKKFHLTPRQRQVGELIAAGSSRKEISATLGISVWTVNFHLVNIRHKLDTLTVSKATVKILRSVTYPKL
jgi:DNA-binding CsgD family transcriptional regulator